MIFPHQETIYFMEMLIKLEKLEKLKEQQNES